MNAWDLDPNLYLPVLRLLAARLRAWRRKRREQRMPAPAGCRG